MDHLWALTVEVVEEEETGPATPAASEAGLPPTEERVIYDACWVTWVKTRRIPGIFPIAKPRGICAVDWVIRDVGIAVQALWIAYVATQGIRGVKSAQPADIVSRHGVVVPGF